MTAEAAVDANAGGHYEAAVTLLTGRVNADAYPDLITGLSALQGGLQVDGV